MPILDTGLPQRRPLLEVHGFIAGVALVVASGHHVAPCDPFDVPRRWPSLASHELTAVEDFIHVGFWRYEMADDFF